MTPLRHVLVALSLSALVFVIAGDRWNTGMRAIRPVKLVGKRT